MWNGSFNAAGRTRCAKGPTLALASNVLSDTNPTLPKYDTKPMRKNRVKGQVGQIIPR